MDSAPSARHRACSALTHNHSLNRTRLGACLRRPVGSNVRQQPMTTTDALYAEVKSDMAAITEPLFEFSEQCLRKNGNFLPHAAMLTSSGEVRLVSADPGNERTNSTEVLPLLHDGLRAQAETVPLKALGIAENVTVSLEGQRSTKAIKVLFEHQRGLTVALYLPFEKKFLKGYVFGNSFLVVANPEVKAWSRNAA